MIEFILGRAGSGKTELCLETMCQRIAKDPLGDTLLYLVPEHETYKLEQRLAEKAKNGGYFRLIVSGFRRLSQHVLQDTGGANRPQVSAIGRRIFLKQILEEKGDALQVFQKAAKQRGFAESLEEMLDEFCSCGFNEENFEKAIDAVQDDYLKQKLADFALLYRCFREKMQGHFDDSTDLFELLIKQIPKSELLKNVEIWVDGFIFFNPMERRVLAALCKRAKAVHIALTLDPNDLPEDREAGLFFRQWRTLQSLEKLAQELQIPAKKTVCKSIRRFTAPALRAVEEQLYSVRTKASDTTGVQIFETATRRLELETVAADILRLVRENGFRYQDIAILVRDDAVYAALPFILEDYSIPFYEDKKRAVVHHPLSELIRSSFEVIQRWPYEAVFRALKTDFFPLTREQIDRLENYAITFGIRGKRWTMEEPWYWKTRYSLDDEDTLEETSSDERLTEVNYLRRKVVKPLAELQEGMQKAKTVRERTHALYQYICSLKVPEILSGWAETAEKEGKLAEAREHRQMWNKVMELFDQLVETAGDEEISCRMYLEILEDGLDGLMISMIPPGIDYVTVAPFDQHSIENARAVYILGVNEGIMPRRMHEKGLLTDADRLHLSEAGFELPTGAAEASLGERFAVYDAFTAGREYTAFSYALADSEGGALLPSSLIHRIRKLLPGVSFLSLQLDVAERQDVLRVAEGRQAISAFASALRGCREARVLDPVWKAVYNWGLASDRRSLLEQVLKGFFSRGDASALLPETASALYTKNGKLGGSVTRFEAFQACPFRHFARYGLDLKERQERTFQAPDLGVLLHGVLKSFGEELAMTGRSWGELSDAEGAELSARLTRELAPKLQNELLLSTAQYQHLLTRIEILAERAVLRLISFDRVSKFHPTAFEQSFGMGIHGLPPLSYRLEAGYRLEIRGQIDRVDRSEDGRYFMIIDYKTGQAYINLLEVYYGLKLQLLTYLLVEWSYLKREEGEILPAAMLYCFLKNPLITNPYRLSDGEVEKKLMQELRMPGWVTADEEVIRSIDPDQKYIRVALKVHGGIDARSAPSIRTTEQFAMLLDYTENLLQRIGNRILSGEVKAEPYRLKGKTPCAHCSYQVLCGFDPILPGMQYKECVSLTDQEIMTSLKEKKKVSQ
ncbi:helicase-exonuclease AddAB subunit AddB [Selenomonas sp. TAMA-11512]|uniref:helicase-exonuclease AddAB subunit AddB n=1 Tax=Selenomonas sp. TAMA-11512 TaxID=3095337 RepID=UPI003086AD41|nr:helicase-exonuclease AddAB subunit AddB [Selenomonas sp. TAMA-11512]